MKIFCDTSVLVAGCIRCHPHFNRAHPVLAAAVKRSGSFYCAAHSIAEMYAVLTRMPSQPRIHPADALKMIQQNVIAHFKVVSLDADAYQKVVSQCVENGLTGGVVYDALILQCAKTVKPDRIYTFNVHDFQRVSMDLASKVIAP